MWYGIQQKKKKTIIWILVGIIAVAIAGTIIYFAWPKNKSVENKKQKEETNSKEEIQKVKTELNSVKSKLNNVSDNAKKTQLENKLTDIEKQVNNLSSQVNSPSQSTIKNLEAEIKEIKKELESNKPGKNDKPNDKDDSPEPDPQPDNNKVISYVATKINDNTYKYHFTTTGEKGEKLTWKKVIRLLEWKYTKFFEAFQGALKDANSKFPAYFWECPPVSEKTLDKPFEFVVIKSEGLDSMTQDWKPFREYLAETSILGKLVISFPNNQKPSDAILVIPAVKPASGEKYDYKNLSQFTKNAPEEQQQELWKEVAEKLSEELGKGDAPRWLSTHGLGVKYLHVRIDEKPKYYSHAEYKKWE